MITTVVATDSFWPEYIELLRGASGPTYAKRWETAQSGFHGELKSVLNVQIHQGDSLAREVLARLSGDFVA